jgi:long-chain acyl-CoA synthetase
VLLEDYFALPLLRIFCRVHTEGAEALRDLKGPLLIVSNHISFFDAPVIFSALPREIRDKTAIATWREYFTPKKGNPFAWLWKRLCYGFASLGFNSFMFSTERNFKQSFEHAGWLVDHGFNLLFFPEGARTETGRMQRFREGVGMLVEELGIPVVPVGLRGLFEIYPVQSPLPVGRGPVVCRFGRPLELRGRTHAEAARILEAAVADLIR